MRHQHEEKPRNIVAFFVFGFIGTACGNCLSLCAAEDILVGSNQPTSLVYVCDTFPYIGGCFILLLFLPRLSPLVSVVATTSLFTAGIILVACAEPLELKLVGVGVIPLGGAIADVGLLPLSAYYEEVASRAYTAGTDVGSLVTAVYYTGIVPVRLSFSGSSFLNRVI